MRHKQIVAVPSAATLLTAPVVSASFAFGSGGVAGGHRGSFVGLIRDYEAAGHMIENG